MKKDNERLKGEIVFLTTQLQDDHPANTKAKEPKGSQSTKDKTSKGEQDKTPLQSLCSHLENELEERNNKILRMSEMVFVLQEEKAKSFSSLEQLEKELAHFKALSHDLLAEKRLLNSNILGSRHCSSEKNGSGGAISIERQRINQLQNQIEEMKKEEEECKRQIQAMQIKLKEKETQNGLFSGFFGSNEANSNKLALRNFQSIVNTSCSF